MRARGRYSAEYEQTYSVRELLKDLEDEIANLRDENTDRKEKIRKLNIIQKGLTTQQTAASKALGTLGKNPKYAHV